MPGPLLWKEGSSTSQPPGDEMMVETNAHDPDMRADAERYATDAAYRLSRVSKFIRGSGIH
jgi:hypothetical protein